MDAQCRLRVLDQAREGVQVVNDRLRAKALIFREAARPSVDGQRAQRRDKQRAELCLDAT